MPKPKGRAMQPDINANHQRPCSHARCTRPRHGISKWCSYHGKRNKLYGSPEGRRIRRWEYKQEVKEARAVILANKSNPAIIEAVALLQGWLEEAARGRKVAAREDMDRLFNAGVTGLDVLIEAAALWLWFDRRKHHYDNGPELTHQIGTAVILLKPRPAAYRNRDGSARYKPVGAVARRECGGLIRKHLATVLHNISQRVLRDELEVQQRAETLRTPLS